MSVNFFTHSLLYGGSLKSKLETGRAIVVLLQNDLGQDSTFQKEFSTLKKRATALNSHMVGMNLGDLCSGCAANPDGGCCSRYMSGETDAIQIALNLLAAIDVEFVQSDKAECIYLGEKGCIFTFKPMFCLNYNCSHIHRWSSESEVKQMEYLAGSLLQKQYELEQYIRRRLQELQGQ